MARIIDRVTQPERFGASRFGEVRAAAGEEYAARRVDQRQLARHVY
jgi:hypothetical protein